MIKTIKQIGIIAIAAIMLFAFVSFMGCKDSDEGATLSGIAVTTNPTKTAYTAGETLNLGGLVVTATYSDGSKKAVTGYTTVPANGAALNDTSLTSVAVSYTEDGVTKGTSFAITVSSVGGECNCTGESDCDCVSGCECPACETPAFTYTITGSGTAFTATRGGTTVGEADQPIQDVIDAIRADADGEDVTIIFGVDNGDGTFTALDIGEETVRFENDSTEVWGKITLRGKITGSVANSSTGTIHIADSVSVTSTGDIANTGNSSGRAVYNESSGTVTIFGGTVSATAGRAVYNQSSGTVTISDGTVSVQGTGRVVHNESSGTVKITGGTVKNNFDSTNSRVIHNESSGTVEITGGIVQNTSSSSNSSAVYNYGSGTVTIFGGTVSSAAGRAITNYSTGTINISGAGAFITSENTSSTGGTIRIGNAGGILNVNSGTIKNMAHPDNGGSNSSAKSIYAVTNATVNINETNPPLPVIIPAYESPNTLNISESEYETIADIKTAFDELIADYESVKIIGTRDSVTQKLTLDIPEGKSVNWTATISGTADPLIELTDAGTFNITDGEITAATNRAIINGNTGEINISGGVVTSTDTRGLRGTIVLTATGTLNMIGGTISNTDTVTTDNANAIRIDAAGTVNISGGTVTSNSARGMAISIASASTGASINISQAAGKTTLIASEHASIGTIMLVATSTLTISGGKIENTSTNTNARAIQNPVGSTVDISGGEVRIAVNNGNPRGDAKAIRNEEGVTISGTAEVDGFTNPFPLYADFTITFNQITDENALMPWDAEGGITINRLTGSPVTIALTSPSQYGGNIKWLLDGEEVAASYGVSYYTLDPADFNRTEIGTYILTVRVKLNGVWYSRSIEFNVE